MGHLQATTAAGLFYPAGESELRELVSRLLNQVDRPLAAPKALIAPHAGYRYSGPTAASAYATLASVGKDIKKVVLLGPAHYEYFEGLALSDAERFQTPLGTVQVDFGQVHQAGRLPAVSYRPTAFGREHSLEVQLPFLQTILRDFRLIPALVGHASGEQVARFLEECWNGPETLVVASSDLSHFLPYQQAQDLDRQTARAITSLQPQQLSYENACGIFAVKGLLQLARKLQMHVVEADLRNSGDTAGPRDQVVGYGAFLFYEARFPPLQPTAKYSLP